MKLPAVGMMAIDSSRTRAYLGALIQRDLLPSHVIFLTGGPDAAKPSFPPVSYFDNSTPALETVRAHELPCTVVDTGDVNSPEVVAAVKTCPVEVLIYSGPGGAILGSEILSRGKRFLHIHPGFLPSFRGSTTVYYSLLTTRECGVSALFLSEDIDTGPLLARATYPPPANRTTIDQGYDPYIRSDLLIRVLLHYEETGKFPEPQSQRADQGETFYIIHPVLKHIAILSTDDAEK